MKEKPKRKSTANTGKKASKDQNQDKKQKLSITKDMETYFNIFPHPVGLVSPKGYFIRLNSSWESLTGYSVKDLESRPFEEFLHPEDVEPTVKSAEQCLSGGIPVKVINRFRCRDSSYRSLEWYLQPDHHPGFIFIVARDITESITLIDSISKREKHFLSVLESTGIGLLVADNLGSIVQMNSRFSKMWGLPEEITGNNDDEKIWEKILEQVKEPHLFRERVVDLLHSREISKDVIYLNDNRVFERSSNPLVIDELVVGRSWGFNDITNRIRIESALKESEKNFRSLAEYSPNMIFINIKGRVVYVNQLTVKIMGFTREEFYSEDFYFLSITAPEYKELVKEKFRLHLQGKEVEPYEYAVITKDGRKLYTVLSTKLINFNGEKAILGMITDITERKVAQVEVERINEELSKINTTKDTFFSIIAHDLKNPFNTIFWFSSTLMNDIPKISKEEIISRVEHISNSSKNAYLLVENLLLWAQSQNRSIPFSVETQDISLIVRENIEMIRDQLHGKMIHLSNRIEKCLQIPADKNMISTVIRNILCNAIQFTPENGKIEIFAVDHDHELEIHIKDTGIGIEKENLASIFRIEAKGSLNTSHKNKGSGLGLIICREFIERHGGSIRAESEIGKGSTFIFSLPKKLIP